MRGNQNKKLSIITTFRNEEEILPEFIRQVSKVSEKCIREKFCSSYEIILVNDDSTDRSLEVLEDISKTNDAIRIVTTSRVFGVDECFVLALKYVSGDLIVSLESDLQDPPDLIPSFLEKLTGPGDFEVIHGVKSKRLGESLIKRAVTHIGYKLIFGMSYLNLPMQASNFKAFTRKIADKVNALDESKPFFRGLITWAGYKQGTYSFERHSRYSGESKFPVLGSRVIANFLNSALISYSSFPLKLSLLFGAALVMLTVAGLVVAVTAWVLGGIPSPIFFLALLIVALFSALCLFIGILGLYIHTIYLEVKKRPVCIVKSLHGFSASHLKNLISLTA
jgi:glycosyltransferase involved in cell wall biosynthesis